MDYEEDEEEIQQDFPFVVSYYRYHVYQNQDKKPIAKFNYHHLAERFITLVAEQEKTFQRRNTYRLVLNGKTQISL